MEAGPGPCIPGALTAARIMRSDGAVWMLSVQAIGSNSPAAGDGQAAGSGVEHLARQGQPAEQPPELIGAEPTDESTGRTSLKASA